MSKNKRVPKPTHKDNQGPRINPQNATENYVQMFNHRHPIFCFRYVDKEYGIAQCSAIQKKLLLETVHEMSQRTWDEIRGSGRHKSGGEKIPRGNIKRTFPSFLTADVDFLIAYRFDEMKPILCHRDGFICHIIFVDHDRKLYDHGS